MSDFEVDISRELGAIEIKLTHITDQLTKIDSDLRELRHAVISLKIKTGVISAMIAAAVTITGWIVSLGF